MHRIERLVPVATLLLTAVSVAQEKPFAYPDTVVGRHAAAMVEAHNSGEEAKLRAFYNDHVAPWVHEQMPADQMVTQMTQIRQMVGAVKPHSILEEAPIALAILVEFEGGWGRLALECETNPPHLLKAFTIVPAAGPEVEAKSYDQWTDLTELLTLARDDGGFPALAAAIVEGDRVVEAAVVGVRRSDQDQAAEIDDRFHIGSVTKSVTATMIGRLVEEGVLDWSLTVGKALPAAERRAEYREVTLAQLLRHRGGVPRHMTFDDDEIRRFLVEEDPVKQRAAYIAYVLQDEPIDRSVTNYSNAGYALAGHIAERVAGEPWEMLVRTHVFEPAGMRTGGFGWPATSQRPDQPHGHYPGRPQEVDEYDLGWFISPAGSVHCSIIDLGRYAALHLRGLRGADGVLKAATVRMLHTPPADAADERGYAAGWVLDERDGQPVQWHNGSAGTFYTLAALYPDSDRAIVVCTNIADGNTEPIAWKVIEAVQARRDKAAGH